MSNTLLLISPQKQFRTSLKTVLLEQGYQVYTVATKTAEQRSIKRYSPDILILDGAIGELSACAIIRDVKKTLPDIQILFLKEEKVKTRISLVDTIILQKPITPADLLTAVNNAMTQKKQTQTRLKVADLELDSNALEVKRGEDVIILTPQEFKLLHYLMKQQGKVVTRKILLKKIWLYSSDIETRVVDVYIGYLRKKIDKASQKKLLYSIRGIGYMIKE
ncbi:MAG: response regulator transcription factor [Patescibacteria group bacterium]